MKKNGYSYFQNRECEYFPCHPVRNADDFNCLFCYCPLYALGEDCGGKFSYTARGIKDCSACILPHGAVGYDYILSKCPQLADLAKKKERG